MAIYKKDNWTGCQEMGHWWHKETFEPVMKIASIQPLSETPYQAAASPLLVLLSHRFLALYKTNGGNMMPSAEPQPRMVMYSLPGPPPISHTDLAPRLASSLLDVASKQRPVSSAFHNLLATLSSDNSSNSFSFKTFCTKSIQLSTTFCVTPSAVFLERCSGFLTQNWGHLRRNRVQQSLPSTPPWKGFGLYVETR